MSSTIEVVGLVAGWLIFILGVVPLGIVALLNGGLIDAEARVTNLATARFKISSRAKSDASRQADEASRHKGPDHDEALERFKASLARARTTTLSRVLWVDDSPDGNLQELLALRKIGFNILTVTTTAAAVTALEGGSAFDLVITDTTRGRSDRAALELIEHIKSLPTQPPVIVYSNHAAPAREPLEQLGAIIAATPGQLLAAVLDQAIGQRPVRVDLLDVFAAAGEVIRELAEGAGDPWPWLLRRPLVLFRAAWTKHRRLTVAMVLVLLVSAGITAGLGVLVTRPAPDTCLVAKSDPAQGPIHDVSQVTGPSTGDPRCLPVGPALTRLDCGKVLTLPADLVRESRRYSGSLTPEPGDGSVLVNGSSCRLTSPGGVETVLRTRDRQPGDLVVLADFKLVTSKVQGHSTIAVALRSSSNERGIGAYLYRSANTTDAGGSVQAQGPGQPQLSTVVRFTQSMSNASVATNRLVLCAHTGTVNGWLNGIPLDNLPARTAVPDREGFVSMSLWHDPGAGEEVDLLHLYTFRAGHDQSACARGA